MAARRWTWSITALIGRISSRCRPSATPVRSYSWVPSTGGRIWMQSRLLLDRIFPEVRDAEPSARLCLVGRRPPAALVRRVQGVPGVELHADVPDVRPYLARSAVMVVPLRIGGGSRLKILEALAHGLPVISTRVGAEGLELVAGQDYVAADQPETICRELVACLRDPTRALAMAQHGRPFVLDRYDWDKLATMLETCWIECVETLDAIPQETHLR